MDFSSFALVTLALSVFQTTVARAGNTCLMSAVIIVALIRLHMRT